MAAQPDMDLDTLRDMFEEWHLLAAEPEGVCYAEVDARRRARDVVHPPGAARRTG